MSLDIATLALEVDATPLDAAVAALDKLAASAGKASSAAAELRSSAKLDESNARSATQYAAAMGAAERATQSATQSATAFARAQRELLADQRGIAQATAAYDRLRASLDPLAAIEVTLAQRTATLNTALEKGAIDVDEYNTMLARVTKAAADGVEVHSRYAGAAKLSSSQLQNLSFQLNDVLTGLASGQKPMQILAQQGGQIVQALQMGPGGAGGALKAVAGLALEFSPLVAVLGLTAGAVFAFVHEAQSAKVVTDDNKAAIKGLADADDLYSKTAVEAAHSTGQLRDMLQQDAIAASASARAKREAAQANLAHAQSSLAAAQATLAAMNATSPSTGEGAEAMGLATVFQGFVVQKGQTQVTALSKAVRDAQENVLRLQNTLESGGRSMVESLQRQNAEFGKTRAQIILMNAATEAAKPENAALAGSILSAAKVAAAHADAEDRRKLALKDSTKEQRSARAEAEAAAEAYKKIVTAAEAVVTKYATSVEKENQRVAADSWAAWQGYYTGVIKTYDDLQEQLRRIDDYGKKIEAAPKPDLRGFTETSKAAQDFQRQIEAATEAASRGFRTLDNDVNDVFYALHDHNWGMALSGLITALQNVDKQIALVTTHWAQMTKVQQLQSIFGIAGVANTVGQSVGGSTGGFISGAAGGAMAGAQIGSFIPVVGNLIGAGVGAVIGGLGSLLGASSSKKKAKQEAEEQAAEQAAAKALQDANTARSLEITRLQLIGQTTAAVNMQRDAEIAGMTAENAAKAREVYALQDAQAVQAKQLELLQLTGTATEILNAQRKAELATETDAIQAIQKQIYAAQDAQAAAQKVADANAAWQQQHDQEVSDLTSRLTDAYNAQSSALNSAIDKLKSFRDSVADFQNSLLTGDLSGLSVQGAYRAAASDFYSTAAAARAQDPAAQARLLGVEQTFLAASKATAADQLFYLRDLAAVKALNAQLLATSNQQIDKAQAQLDGINATVAGLITVNGSVLQVDDTLSVIAKALRGATGATDAGAGAVGDLAGGAASNDNGGLPAGVSDADVDKVLGLFTMFQDPTSPAFANRRQTAAWEIANVDQMDPLSATYQILKANGFASGGFHSGGLRIVGENGPEIEATGPSRIWSASQTAQMLGGDNSDVVDAINGLRREVAELKSDQRQALKDIKRNTGDTAYALEGSSRQAIPLTVKIAS